MTRVGRTASPTQLARGGPGLNRSGAFGKDPSCWEVGEHWGPQVCGALQQIGVPAFVYSYTAVPGRQSHRFAGCWPTPAAGP